LNRYALLLITSMLLAQAAAADGLVSAARRDAANLADALQ
jgi:hypothetical protein